MNDASELRDCFDEPVFIVGAPRSGTSLVTGALGECGLWLGLRMPGTRANPKGFFENPDFKRQITKPLLVRLGADPLGVQPLCQSALKLSHYRRVQNQPA